MSDNFSLIIKNGSCYINGNLVKTDLGLSGSKIKKIGKIDIILDDGGHFELSVMYHKIILERLLDCINLLSHNKLFKKQYFVLTLHRPSNVDDYFNLDSYLIYFDNFLNNYKIQFYLNHKYYKFYFVCKNSQDPHHGLFT